jgi:hypothetical protein
MDDTPEQTAWVGASNTSDGGGPAAEAMPAVEVLPEFQTTCVIREAGSKLELDVLATCTALAIYHKYMMYLDQLDVGDSSTPSSAGVVGKVELDRGLLTMVVLYLASKSVGTQRDLRDVITVCYSCLNVGKLVIICTHLPSYKPFRFLFSHQLGVLTSAP